MKPATSPILRLVRRSVDDPRKQITDQQLLGLFCTDRDEAAFHTLLCRHGSMVLDVCRSVLGVEADAEDAFQATFLVLVQKAGAIRKQASIGSWLHGVAYRIALKARVKSTRRQKHEVRLPTQPQSNSADELTWREGQQVVHAELSAIAVRYRAPLVLCYLEGKTQAEAATALGVSTATVNQRLERGRVLLRARLVRRGLGAVTVGLTAAWPFSVSAHLPRELVDSTIHAAQTLAPGAGAAVGAIPSKVAALTKGELQAMLLTKLKATALALLALAVVGTATTIAAYPALAAKPVVEVPDIAKNTPIGADEGVPRQPPPPPPPKDPKPKAKPEPAWRAAFQKEYGLKDGVVLKRVAAPYPECRKDWFNDQYGAVTVPGESADDACLFLRFKNSQVVRWTVRLGPPNNAKLSFLIEDGFCLSLREVEALPEVLDSEIEGEFVFRDGTPPEKWVPAFEKILRDECGVKLQLALKEVEREVVVMGGEFKSTPRPGQLKNTVVVAAEPDDPLGGGSIGTFEELLLFLSKFTELHIVSDLKRPPGGQFCWKHRAATTIRHEGRERYTEPRDPDKILKAVTEQTGLTFKTETRKVRVLSIEKAE